MRSLFVLAVLATVAEAAPRYPVQITEVSQAERARRKAAFESRESSWTQVVVNSRGFVSHLETTDPTIPATLNGVDLAPIRELLRREAATFGIDAADVDGEFRSLGTCGNQLHQNRNGVVLGRIDLTCRITGEQVTVVIDVIPWLDVTPTLDAEAVTKRALGGRYAITSTGRLPMARDCNMGGRCSPSRTVTRRDVVTLTTEDLIAVDASLYRAGNVLRVVYCVDATWNEPQPRTVVRAIGSAKRLPYVVDAVTGAALDLHPPSCAAIPTL